MKRVRNCVFALLIGCCAPLLIWVGIGVVLFQRRREVNLLEQALPNLACSVNSDCPPGFVCLNGCCVAEKAL